MSNETRSVPDQRRRWWKFFVTSLVVAVLGTSISLAMAYWLGYIPGTLQTTINGKRIEAWGTGVLTHEYSSGVTQSRHWFRAGKHLKSEWYKPDGTVLDTTLIKDGVPAKFYQLRDDGTVSDQFFLLDGVPDGRWLHFDREGGITRIDTLAVGLIVDRKHVVGEDNDE